MVLLSLLLHLIHVHLLLRLLLALLCSLRLGLRLLCLHVDRHSVEASVNSDLLLLLLLPIMHDWLLLHLSSLHLVLLERLVNCWQRDAHISARTHPISSVSMDKRCRVVLISDDCDVAAVGE